MGPLSKEEFQDQIIANRVAHGVRGVRCDASIGLSGVIETILGDGNE